MFRDRFRSVAALGLLAAWLTGCGTPGDLQQRFALRYGPDPALPAGPADAVLHDQVSVLKYIQSRMPVTPAPTPYDMAVWGFNVGRQDCEIYMNVLFRLNREKLRNTGLLTALHTFSAGIVTAATGSGATLSVLAASFGLAQALSDAYYSTYLFSESPGLLSKKVKDMQDAYAESIHKNWQTQLKSPADIYNSIREYYAICLPENIEGVLLEAVANSKGKSQPPAGSAGNPTTPNRSPRLTGPSG